MKPEGRTLQFSFERNNRSYGHFGEIQGRISRNFSRIQTAWRMERHSNHQYKSLGCKALHVRSLRESCYSEHSPRLHPGQAVRPNRFGEYDFERRIPGDSVAESGQTPVLEMQIRLGECPPGGHTRSNFLRQDPRVAIGHERTLFKLLA